MDHSVKSVVYKLHVALAFSVMLLRKSDSEVIFRNANPSTTPELRSIEKYFAIVKHNCLQIKEATNNVIDFAKK